MRCTLLVSLCSAVTFVAGCYQAHEVGRADAATSRDGGDGGAPVSCDEESLPAYDGPPCSAAVSACRDACGMDEPCRDACLDMPCRECVYGTIFHCANEAGCEPLWRDFACCIQGVPTCGDLRGLERVRCASSCPMQFEPYRMCIESRGGMNCFMQAAMVCGVH